MTTRQYARLVSGRVATIGLDPRFFGTHSLRRTKATLIYRRTGNLRAVQLLLGHTKIESTVRYLGIEVDDALVSCLSVFHHDGTNLPKNIPILPRTCEPKRIGGPVRLAKSMLTDLGVFVSVGAVGAKLVAFALQYGVFRMIVRQRIRNPGRSEAQFPRVG